MNEVHTRVSVAVILIPLALFALTYGGLPLVIAFFTVASLGSHEYLNMMRNKGIKIGYHWIGLSSLCYILLIAYPEFQHVLLWAILLVGLVEALFNWNVEFSIPRLFASLFGLVYTAVLPAFTVRIGLNYPEEKILLALILMIWIVDSIAYFVGMKFGKKRNITAVSPRKSAEGFIAGVLAPWLIAIILSLFFPQVLPFEHLMIIAFAAGVFGQLGDLVESMLKRYCNVKDSSNLIPGHGGILDRTDSVLLAGSFVFCALEFLLKVR